MIAKNGNYNFSRQSKQFLEDLEIMFGKTSIPANNRSAGNLPLDVKVNHEVFIDMSLDEL